MTPFRHIALLTCSLLASQQILGEDPGANRIAKPSVHWSEGDQVKIELQLRKAPIGSFRAAQLEATFTNTGDQPLKIDGLFSIGFRLTFQTNLEPADESIVFADDPRLVQFRKVIINSNDDRRRDLTRIKTIQPGESLRTLFAFDRPIASAGEVREYFDSTGAFYHTSAFEESFSELAFPASATSVTVWLSYFRGFGNSPASALRGWFGVEDEREPTAWTGRAVSGPLKLRLIPAKPAE